MPAWSGLNNNRYGVDYALPTIKGGIKLGIARMFRVGGARKQMEIFDTILGAAAGSAASKTHTQVNGAKEYDGGFGGRRTIETVTDISRNSTAADITDAKATVAGLKTSSLTQIYDAAGNSQGRQTISALRFGS